MNGQEKGLVTVIIPAYNMEEYVSIAVLSALKQDYVNIEVIAVNDCSTDRTGEILDTLALQDTRLRVLHRVQNSNLPAVARNQGLHMARGEYVAFLDHDDVWSSSKISRQVKVMQLNENIAMAYSHLFSVGRNTPLAGLKRLPRLRNWRSDFHPLNRGSVIQCSSVIIRRKIIEDFGGFSEDVNLRAVEDFHLWYRVGLRHAIAFIPEIDGKYRISPGSTSQESNVTAKFQALNAELGCELTIGNAAWSAKAPRIIEMPPVLAKLLLVQPIRRLLRLSPKYIIHKTSNQNAR